MDLHHLVTETAAAFYRMAFAFALLTALELMLPKGESPAAGRLKGLLFWVLWLPATTAVFGIFSAIWNYAGVQPLIHVPLGFSWTGVAAYILGPLAGAIVTDFFFYWFHRGQHAFLWRFHAVHHSIRDMNAVNSFHHITESLMSIVLFVIPSSLIVADTGPILPAIAAALLVYPILLHSPTRFNFGPFRVVFADNRFHRIHHSLEEHHFDKNFGAFTTIWDRLFGTAYFPKKDEWPDTGIEGVDQPRNVRDWLLLPARVR